MDFNKVISALNSNTRQQIIKILGRGPATVAEIFQEIKKNQRVGLRYRESVYRALEKMVEAELIEKYYEKDKGICYRLLTRKIKLDLVQGIAEGVE
jgi:Fe2+ or Zn2+ uptake regulation protein